MCLALGVERLDDAAAKLGSVLEMQPPEGLVDKVRGPEEAEVDRRLAAEDGPRAPRTTTSSSKATTSISTCSRSSTAGPATRRRSSRSRR